MEIQDQSLVINEAQCIASDCANKLSAKQQKAIAAILKALEKDKVVVALSGPAGSGKTSIIEELSNRLNNEAVITATTNKAVEILRQKKLPTAITIFRACLSPVYREPGASLGNYFDMDDPVDGDLENYLFRFFDKAKLRMARVVARISGRIAGSRVLGIRNFNKKYLMTWEPKKKQNGILIVDEASMLGKENFAKIQKCFSKIILIGDEYQLPAVNQEPVFWNDEIIDCRIRLTEIFRQDVNSQAFMLAENLKSGKAILPKKIDDIDLMRLQIHTPIIVWRNELRSTLTKRIREELGFTGPNPQPGESIVCIDNHTIGETTFVKNTIWLVESVDENGKCILVSSAGHRTKRPILVTMEEYETGAGLTCRFAYAITCHTAQGSEWDRVMIHVFDAERCLSYDKDLGMKWLYTAVTRARKEVVWVNNQIAPLHMYLPMKPCEYKVAEKLSHEEI